MAGLLLLLVLAGCGPDAGNVFDLEVGDCFAEPVPGVEIVDVEVIDCDEPHDAEVFDTQRFDEEQDYPGEEPLVTTAEARCIEAFEAYVGRDFDTSRLDLGTLVPTETSWEQGDRELACYLAAPPGEQLTGSMRGSGE